MRTLLLTVFWVTNLSSAIHLLIVASASWIIFAGAYSFSDLNLDVYITQYVYWVLWIKMIIAALLGDFGNWILAIPILIISPLKIIGGTLIGVWAYTVAKNMPAEMANT